MFLLEEIALSNILQVLLLGLLLTSKKYGNYAYLKIFLVANIVFSILYSYFFRNWYFYQFLSLIESSFFSLAFREIYHKATGRNLRAIWLLIAIILLVPLLPISIDKQVTLPYMFVSLVILSKASSIFESRHPMLILFVLSSAYAVSIDVLLVFYQYSEVTTLWRDYSWLSGLIDVVGLIIIVSWVPIVTSLHRFLNWLLTVNLSKKDKSDYTRATFDTTVLQQWMVEELFSCMWQESSELQQRAALIADSVKNNKHVRNPLAENQKFNIRVFTATDDSMKPTVVKGDLICIRNIPMNFDTLEDGSIYVVELSDGDVLLRTFLFNEAQDTVQLVPINEKHYSVNKPCSDIRNVFRIITIF